MAQNRASPGPNESIFRSSATREIMRGREEFFGVFVEPKNLWRLSPRLWTYGHTGPASSRGSEKAKRWKESLRVEPDRRMSTPSTQQSFCVWYSELSSSAQRLAYLDSFTHDGKEVSAVFAADEVPADVVVTIDGGTLPPRTVAMKAEDNEASSSGCVKEEVRFITVLIQKTEEEKKSADPSSTPLTSADLYFLSTRLNSVGDSRREVSVMNAFQVALAIRTSVISRARKKALAEAEPSDDDDSSSGGNGGSHRSSATSSIFKRAAGTRGRKIAGLALSLERGENVKVLREIANELERTARRHSAEVAQDIRSLANDLKKHFSQPLSAADSDSVPSPKEGEHIVTEQIFDQIRQMTAEALPSFDSRRLGQIVKLGDVFSGKPIALNLFNHLAETYPDELGSMVSGLSARDVVFPVGDAGDLAASAALIRGIAHKVSRPGLGVVGREVVCSFLAPIASGIAKIRDLNPGSSTGGASGALDVDASVAKSFLEKSADEKEAPRKPEKRKPGGGRKPKPSAAKPSSKSKKPDVSKPDVSNKPVSSPEARENNKRKLGVGMGPGVPFASNKKPRTEEPSDKQPPNPENTAGGGPSKDPEEEDVVEDGARLGADRTDSESDRDEGYDGQGYEAEEEGEGFASLEVNQPAPLTLQGSLQNLAGEESEDLRTRRIAYPSSFGKHLASRERGGLMRKDSISVRLASLNLAGNEGTGGQVVLPLPLFSNSISHHLTRNPCGKGIPICGDSTKPDNFSNRLLQEAEAMPRPLVFGTRLPLPYVHSLTAISNWSSTILSVPACQDVLSDACADAASIVCPREGCSFSSAFFSAVERGGTTLCFQLAEHTRRTLESCYQEELQVMNFCKDMLLEGKSRLHILPMAWGDVGFLCALEVREQSVVGRFRTFYTQEAGCGVTDIPLFEVVNADVARKEKEENSLESVSVTLRSHTTLGTSRMYSRRSIQSLYADALLTCLVNVRRATDPALLTGATKLVWTISAKGQYAEKVCQSFAYLKCDDARSKAQKSWKIREKAAHEGERPGTYLHSAFRPWPQLRQQRKVDGLYSLLGVERSENAECRTRALHCFSAVDNLRHSQRNNNLFVLQLGHEPSSDLHDQLGLHHDSASDAAIDCFLHSTFKLNSST